MSREEELQNKIAELEAQLKPLKEELNSVWTQQEQDIEYRIKEAHMGNGTFKLDELRFSATERCPCGAGYAYPKNISPHGSWDCSSILMGKANPGTMHGAQLPFAFHNLKSEDQLEGKYTTRPEN